MPSGSSCLVPEPSRLARNTCSRAATAEHSRWVTGVALSSEVHRGNTLFCESASLLLAVRKINRGWGQRIYLSNAAAKFKSIPARNRAIRLSAFGRYPVSAACNIVALFSRYGLRYVNELACTD